MAFSYSSFTTVAHGLGSNRIHHYVTSDDGDTVSGSGYFNDLSELLHQFDVIFCVVDTGGSPVPHILTVTSATGAATVTTAAYPIEDPT